MAVLRVKLSLAQSALDMSDRTFVNDFPPLMLGFRNAESSMETRDQESSTANHSAT